MTNYNEKSSQYSQAGPKHTVSNLKRTNGTTSLCVKRWQGMWSPCFLWDSDSDSRTYCV